MADLEARDLWKLFILTNLLLARGDSLPLDLYDLYIYRPLRQASGRASELSYLAPSFLLLLLWCNNKLICWQESYPTEHRLQTASPTAHQPSPRHNPEISLTPGPLEDCGFLNEAWTDGFGRQSRTGGFQRSLYEACLWVPTPSFEAQAKCPHFFHL